MQPTAARTALTPLAWAEALLALAVLACFGYQVWFFRHEGYLAQPFFYDTLDTLMDLHHTAFWSHTEGAYSVWNSIYPPLSFALLKVLTPAQCYLTDPFIGRDCNPTAWLGLAAGIVAVGVTVHRRAGSELHAVQRWARVLALMFGLPMLFGLERGNLVLWAIPSLVWGLARERCDWKAALALAVAINLKPYLLIALLPVALVHGLRNAAGVVAACALVYGASVAVVAVSIKKKLLANMQSFVGEGALNFWEKIYFSTSFSPVLRALLSDLPIQVYMDSRTADRMVAVMTQARWLSLVVFALALGVSLLQPRRGRSLLLLSALVMGFALSLTEAMGGYTLGLLVALVFLLPASACAAARAWLAACVIACYVLSLPIDLIVIVIRESDAPIWLSGLLTEVKFGISVGQALRPTLVYLVQIVLAGVVILLGWRQAAERLHLPTRASFLQRM